MARYTVRRARDGRFQVRLSDDERDLILSLTQQLREMLVGDQTEGLERLFPPAYANDEEREKEYSVLTHDELLEKRLASIDVVEHTITLTSLDQGQISAWMGAINDLRLVLGTRLDITEEMDEVALDDPRAHAFAVYHYLTHMLAEIVHALSE